MTPPGNADEDATVLVVDDEPDVRQVVSLVLRRSGYEVLEAGDGEEAVARVREQGDRIDVVLLDVMMPGMTGHDALPAIRDLVPTMPVVFFSGYDRSEVAAHLDDPVAPTTFLPKPFGNQDLVDAIAEAIDGSGRAHSDI